MFKISDCFLPNLFLTGCFAEDYDVGVPTAHLNLGISTVQLTEANINWKTGSEDVKQTIKDIEEYALSLDEITVFPEQTVSLEFKENKDNSGDIWTDVKVKIYLLKDGKQTELKLTEYGEFQFPAAKGDYTLVVDFKNSAGHSQYAGNLVIR